MTAISILRRPASIISARALSAYEQCPRRFFYTHILGFRGSKKPTAFTRTHDCIRELIEWLAKARCGGEPTLAEANAAFDEIWHTRGPIDHGYAPDYRRLAEKLVSSLVAAGAGRRFRESEPLAIDLPNGRVVVKPDEMANLPDGTVVLRRIRTGKKRSDEYDQLEYTLYHLAGQARYGAAVRVEALHLTSGGVAEPVEVTPAKVTHRREKSDRLLAGINAGQFPPELDSVVCPRCPHFLYCAAVPAGALTTVEES